jgi:hypothetical protein
LIDRQERALILSKQVIALIATLLLLSGVTAQHWSDAKPEDAEQYHEQIRLAVEALPYQLGSWVGEDVPVPEDAVKLLRPNAITSRDYRDSQTRQNIKLLIVQCEEARDMAGHYPPVCYPQSGWTAKHVGNETQWTLADGKVVKGMKYEFVRLLPTQSSTLYVNHVFILPGGQNAQSIERVRTLAADYRQHFYGAGQIHIVFGEDVDAKQRKRITRFFLEASRPVIDAISAGATDG